MENIKQQIEKSDDYQLKSLIKQYTRFETECVSNTSSNILKILITCAKEECDKRNIKY